MRTLIKLTFSTALAFLAVFQTAHAATLTNYDSIVSLATNVTKNYTFTDTDGAYVVVAVTMTPYSQSNASPAFSLLDNYNHLGYVHLGVNSGLGGGDGNWVDSFEGANFTATLVSSSGVMTNSIQFGIIGLGIRPNTTANLRWTSPVITNAITATADQLSTLDNGVVSLAGTVYSGQLRTISGLYQLSDYNTLSNQSIVMQMSFDAISGAAATLSPPVLANSQFQFSVTGTADANYIVQASTTLTNWTSISTNTAPFTFVETNAAQYPHRYYRAVSP